MGDASNLSREFRTLVTLIRAPLEDELADRGAPVARRERAKALHHNIMRLLQLVNSLFDMAQGGPARRAGRDLVDASAETLIIPTLRDGPSNATVPRESLTRERSETDSELARVHQALAAFSRSVSHDLRGPLRAVDGFSQVLLADHAHALDQDGRALLEQICAGTQRMSAIMDDLLWPPQQDPG
jgi:signal transduction histidine kinase